MTERNEMPTPVPKYLKVAACKMTDRNLHHSVFDWSKGTFAYAVCELLWERGEREPVDPDIAEVEQIANDVCDNWEVGRIGMEASMLRQAARLAIKRGRELAEAKP